MHILCIQHPCNYIHYILNLFFVQIFIY
ncbi:hypothetical protein ACQ27_gp575 [Klebsiella phage K64-1]|nr:hypothetical protein ACQ27_gp575 [Klebsiella phage K64-1]